MMIFDKNGELTAADQEAERIVMQQETRENRTREELTKRIHELSTISDQLKAENAYLKNFIRDHITKGEELLRSIENIKGESLDVYDEVAYTEQKNTEQGNLDQENYHDPDQTSKHMKNTKEEVHYGLRP